MQARGRSWARLIMLIAALHLVIAGCGGDGSGNFTVPGPTTPPAGTAFEGDPLNLRTSSDGRVQFTSDSIVTGRMVTYDVAVVDQSGVPLRNVDVSYYEHQGKALFYVYDPSGTHVPAMAYAPPQELEDVFGRADGVQSGADYQSPEVIGLFIGLVFVIAAITLAEVQFIFKAYRIQSFYMTDAIEVTEDYVLYCKTWEEIAQLIKDQIGGVLNLTSIIVAYGTAGVPEPYPAAWGLPVEKVADSSVNQLRDQLLNQAIDAWAVAEESIRDRKVAVKVFPFHEDSFARGFRNMFAHFIIERNNLVCEQTESSVYGEVKNAETGSTLSGVRLELTGGSTRTATTDGLGQYSFPDVATGNYSLTASKVGYITEVRNITVSQGPVVVNFVLSRELEQGKLRMVLSWGAHPIDLDAHLWVDDLYHVYWMNKGSENQFPYATLDVDDRNGYGPETLTIHQLAGSSVCAIYNYSGESDIKTSGAEVRVYRGSSLERVFTVPSSGTGRWWYVLDVNEDGSLRPRDYLTDTTPGVVAPVALGMK